MIPLPSGARVWLATGHTDMRKGYQSLAVLVQETLKRDPHDGHLFVFRGRRADRHDAIRRRRPKKTTALKPLRKQTLPLTIVPEAFDEIAAPTTKNEKMPVMWIALERLLHQ